MTVVHYKGNQGGNEANEGRGPSPYVWADCPWKGLKDGTVDGLPFFYDFENDPFTVPTTEANNGIFKGFSSTGGVMTQASNSTAAENAFGAISLGSDGDNEGASIATVSLPWKLVGPNTTASARSGKFWLEARIKTSTITDTKHGFFLGLLDSATLSATVPIAADGTLADENFVGFHRLEGDGDKLDTVYKADGVTQVNVATDAVTLVADTYVKVAMKYDPLDHVLRFYANGVELEDTKTIPAAAGTDFPNDVQMGFVFAVLNATATTPGTTTIDWVRIAQLAA